MGRNKSAHMKKAGAQTKQKVGQAHNLRFQIFAPTTLHSLVFALNVTIWFHRIEEHFRQLEP